MDYHAKDNHQEHVAILPSHVSDLTEIPVTSNLVDHVLGCVPSGFISLGRIEVGTATEEQTGEGDEGEGLEDSPSIR